MTMHALHEAAGPGVGITTGVCSFVGTAGFNLGGGFGFLGRCLGLGCDNVVGLEMVLADGSIVQVDKDREPDLLWASCGGGGGTLGIVTKFTYRLTPLPNGGRFHSAGCLIRGVPLTAPQIDYARGVDNTVSRFMAFQKALPSLDNRFGLFYGIGQAKFTLFGLFLGEPSEALQLLRAAGLLEGLDPDRKVGPGESETAGEQPIGLVLKGWPSYLDWATLMNTPVWIMNAPWGAPSNFTLTPENIVYVKAAQSGEIRIIGGPDYNAWFFSQSRLSGILPEEAVKEIVQYGADVGAACLESKGADVGCLMAIGGHVLGGAYHDRPADATAFPHHDAYLAVDGTIAVPPAIRELIPPEANQLLARPSQLLNGLLSIMKKYDLNAAYANYQPDALSNYEEAYWAGNAPRLAAIKTKYDPLGLFSKPGTMQCLVAAGGPNLCNVL
ncbi:FAD-binding isoform A [Chlorella sorokiniana]|nr:FAD-binding isoform A [Chlorella sorokiniana]|eukprot:PRW57319.1 FAD-binding isoform A [Chlorella sorokiniana]